MREPLLRGTSDRLAPRFFYVYMSNKTDINIPLGAKWLKYVKCLAYETINFTGFRFYLLARSGAGKKLFLCDRTGG